MSTWVWKCKRLLAMGPSEVLYRIAQASRSRIERHIASARVPAPSGASGHPWLSTLPTEFDAACYEQAAERTMEGRFDVFALRGIELGFPPRWNTDPRTGTQAPLTFGKTLDYRDERIVGDIKYLWEPNRHLELVTLAQAWHLTRNERYAAACRILLESWFEQCPYPLGPNWTSSLEHAVRLVNWSFAWGLLGGDHSALFEGSDGAAFRERWLRSIYRHCAFIAGHFSRYSSANNHLLGEYMGLFIAAATWPMWRRSARWLARAKQGLEQEALAQNAADGVNREQAIWYHHEVADMLLLCALVGRANALEFSAAYWRRIEAMLEFVASVMDVDGNVPMIGDSDDAVMVRFVPDERSRVRPEVFRSLLATGAVLYGRGDFKAKAKDFDAKSRWLLGAEGARRFDALDVPKGGPSLRRAFPEGGYWVLGDAFDTSREIRIVADAGALGFLSIAAHGHADALSFTMSVGGAEVLIDPGTYAYHTQKLWRDYFRGTSAHNTVRIDGVDQSVIGGNFMWTRHARARCVRFDAGEEREIWQAEHDGYLRLSDPVTHRRELVLAKRACALQVTDRISCRSTHEVEIHWHFSERCQVHLSEGRAQIDCETARVSVQMADSRLVPEIVQGRNHPPLGWISRRFDEKTASPCLRWSGRITGDTELVTRFEVSWSRPEG